MLNDTVLSVAHCPGPSPELRWLPAGRPLPVKSSLPLGRCPITAACQCWSQALNRQRESARGWVLAARPRSGRVPADVFSTQRARLAACCARWDLVSGVTLPPSQTSWMDPGSHTRRGMPGYKTSPAHKWPVDVPTAPCDSVASACGGSPPCLWQPPMEPLPLALASPGCCVLVGNEPADGAPLM